MPLTLSPALKAKIAAREAAEKLNTVTAANANQTADPDTTMMAKNDMKVEELLSVFGPNDDSAKKSEDESAKKPSQVSDEFSYYQHEEDVFMMSSQDYTKSLTPKVSIEKSGPLLPLVTESQIANAILTSRKHPMTLECALKIVAKTSEVDTKNPPTTAIAIALRIVATKPDDVVKSSKKKATSGSKKPKGPARSKAESDINMAAAKTLIADTRKAKAEEVQIAAAKARAEEEEARKFEKSMDVRKLTPKQKETINVPVLSAPTGLRREITSMGPGTLWDAVTKSLPKDFLPKTPAVTVPAVSPKATAQVVPVMEEFPILSSATTKVVKSVAPKATATTTEVIPPAVTTQVTADAEGDGFTPVESKKSKKSKKGPAQTASVTPRPTEVTEKRESLSQVIKDLHKRVGDAPPITELLPGPLPAKLKLTHPVFTDILTPKSYKGMTAEEISTISAHGSDAYYLGHMTIKDLRANIKCSDQFTRLKHDPSTIVASVSQKVANMKKKITEREIQRNGHRSYFVSVIDVIQFLAFAEYIQVRAADFANPGEFSTYLQDNKGIPSGYANFVANQVEYFAENNDYKKVLASGGRFYWSFTDDCVYTHYVEEETGEVTPVLERVVPEYWETIFEEDDELVLAEFDANERSIVLKEVAEAIEVATKAVAIAVKAAKVASRVTKAAKAATSTVKPYLISNDEERALHLNVSECRSSQKIGQTIVRSLDFIENRKKEGRESITSPEIERIEEAFVRSMEYAKNENEKRCRAAQIKQLRKRIKELQK